MPVYNTMPTSVQEWKDLYVQGLSGAAQRLDRHDRITDCGLRM